MSDGTADAAMNGTTRAAILLLALGEQEAAEVLKHVDTDDVQKLGLQMAELDQVRRDQVALPHGPADGERGLDANEALVQRARKLLGANGEIMLDCWMALTPAYTEKLADRLRRYRVYWMEECLMPDDYVGMERLNAAVDSTRMATGEHEATRYGFELLANRSRPRRRSTASDACSTTTC